MNRTLHRFTPPPATRAQVRSEAEPARDSAAAQATLAGASDPRHPLKNRDLDTGNVVKPAGYRLTDDTYADLLKRLTATPAIPVPPGVKEDILAYYADPTLNFATKKSPNAWKLVQHNLIVLQSMPTSTEPAPYATYGDDPDSN